MLILAFDTATDRATSALVDEEAVALGDRQLEVGLRRRARLASRGGTVTVAVAATAAGRRERSRHEQADPDRTPRHRSNLTFPSITTRRVVSPACSSRTVARSGGSPASPASGHSTKTIASSKYGSRSPHSAADTPVNR